MSPEKTLIPLELLPDEHRPYLDLLAKSLTNYLYLGADQSSSDYCTLATDLYENFNWKIAEEARPHTLLYKGQLRNLEACIYRAVRDGVQGDMIEAGVWRGGASLYMRAVLKALGVTDRRVWLSDTFEGIPIAQRYTDIHDPVDNWDDRWCASLDQVRSTFKRYEMLDDQVRFLEGPFSETLGTDEIGDLAVARLDGDAYESTRDAIEALYPRIQPGGFIIIDDWHIPSCRRAVTEYREKNGIKESVRAVVSGGKVLEAFWRVSTN